MFNYDVSKSWYKTVFSETALPFLVYANCSSFIAGGYIWSSIDSAVRVPSLLQNLINLTTVQKSTAGESIVHTHCRVP